MKSKLYENTSNKRIFHIDRHVGVVSTQCGYLFAWTVHTSAYPIWTVFCDVQVVWFLVARLMPLCHARPVVFLSNPLPARSLCCWQLDSEDPPPPEWHPFPLCLETPPSRFEFRTCLLTHSASTLISALVGISGYFMPF